MHKVINVDTTGLEILETLHRKLVRSGKTLILAAPNDQPRSLFERSGFVERLTPDNLTIDIAAALDRARAVIESAYAPLGAHA
jgi:SulP family sulfate permease